MAVAAIKKNSEKISTDNMEKYYENYILIDIGAYLAHKKYSRDLDSVIQRAKDAGNFVRRRRIFTIFLINLHRN